MPLPLIHWNADPALFTLGPLTVRWYGVLFATGFLLGFYIMQWIYRREQKPLAELDHLLLYMLIGTVVGARLGHVLFYDPGYYFSHPLDILKIWEGGLASHGAAIGVLLALFIYQRKYPYASYLWLLDRLSIPAALAGMFIRIGNFMNSEILGTPTGGNWGVVFDRVDPLPRHPVQLYEAAAYAFIFVVLFVLYRRPTIRARTGVLIGTLLSLVFLARFLLEFIKTRQAAYEANFEISVGQWLSIPFMLLGVALLVYAFSARAKAR